MRFAGPGSRGPVFVGSKGGLLRRSNFQPYWTSALKGAGLDGVHIHDLRHTGNTLTAQAGATLPDLMVRMGRASSRADLSYLHTNSTRDRAVAAALDGLVKRGRARNGHEMGEKDGGAGLAQRRKPRDLLNIRSG